MCIFIYKFTDWFFSFWRQGRAAAPLKPPCLIFFPSPRLHMLHQGSAQLNKLLGFRFLGLSLPAGGFIIIVRFTCCEGQLMIGRDIDSWNRQQNDSVFHTPSLVVNSIIQALLKAHFHMKCKLFLRIGFFSAGSTPQDCCYLQLSPFPFEDGLK